MIISPDLSRHITKRSCVLYLHPQLQGQVVVLEAVVEVRYQVILVYRP